MFWKALKIGGLVIVFLMTLAAALLAEKSDDHAAQGSTPAVAPQPAAPAPSNGPMRFN
jgi:hypothetical protein